MKILKVIYLIASGLSFLLVCGLTLALTYSFSPLSAPSSRDSVFVLNHGNIVTEQDYSLIYSQQSLPVFNGDHLDYYCIQIEKFEFQRPTEGEWVYGLEDNHIFSQARELAAQSGKIDKCFSGESNPESNDVAAKIWSVDTTRKHVEGAVVIMYHKITKRVLYVTFQT
ncbi:hypothetical protein [Bacterioplanoides sp. SCSIO 12839]|uniref:hypothetical protein n=1 Tax=Bacterioplanoides sp. SCSIO 12839 TaxID=2829569 RepID=UPI0021056014|nr:hypothetical protein [Bacterioplanoides sp. SCSIO 12839]UTW49280.1 hypothetical protein KFF03_05085 [Bacterioplanoides sp. SCSIO 12839]